MQRHLVDMTNLSMLEINNQGSYFEAPGDG